jgi:choline dehydrogenase-like flavoprotein
VARSAIIVGSGAGGSVAAWTLVQAGWDVVILEKGRHLLPGLGTPAGPSTLFSNDEVKAGRSFEGQDIILEPRTSRTQSEARRGVARSFVGDVNTLPTVVGGGTVHWDAKTPRFWKLDFKMRSLYGPVAGANMADWPIEYHDLAPYYDVVEERLGVQGDIHAMPARTLAQSPRRKQFPLPPNPPMYAGRLLAEGASRLGYTAYPFPMAVHSQPVDGYPACNSCGFCSGFGCPINARGGAALSFLHHAVLGGAELRPRCFVYRVNVNASGSRATGVSYLDAQGQHRTEVADVVILATSPIETARIALLSSSVRHPDGLGNSSGQLGRNLMFHAFTIGFAEFGRSPHAWRGPSTTFTIDDFVGPDTGPVARAVGLPFLKGGICETGGSFLLLQEAQIYASFPNVWGQAHKDLMRISPGRVHAAGLSMVGEDLPQAVNRVDLDPDIRDVYGFPVPRITHSYHTHEVLAANYFGPKLAAICQAAPGALVSAFLPLGPLSDTTSALSSAFSTAHIMGTARMGDDPRRSVCDRWGRMHDLDNVYIGDGSVFVTGSGRNPTLTIMALSLRMARQVAGLDPLR